MSYRKFKADYLFDGYRILDNRQVLVTRGDGTIQAIIDQGEAGEDIEQLKGLICPGFINCHCHLELSHLKGQIAMKTGLVNFVLSVVSQRKADPDEILSAMQTAQEEMLNGGIVAVGDICNGSDSLGLKSAGRMAYYNFIELAGWLPQQAQSRFNAGKSLYDEFAEMTGNEDHLSLNPHAPYSVSPRLWDLLKTGFPHKTITIHNQETAAENEFFQSAGGEMKRMYAEMKIDNTHFTAREMNSLPAYLDWLEKAKNILLVHNTFTSLKDFELAATRHPGLFFCLCPNANLYIENRLPDIPALIKQKGRPVIGTDSLASNGQLSVLEEIKTIKKQFPQTGTAELLQWATSNGAQALQYEDSLGDFNSGKKPGLVLIEYKGKDPLERESHCRRIL
jgi:cytosine/adenosine deaminase-related metal-dependent hydrolase